MISFTRGDTFSFKVSVTKKDGSPIAKSEIDTLFITCRQKPNNVYPIIFQKDKDDVEISEDGYVHGIFTPGDTENLEYGFYCFDIEVTLTNGYRKTALYDFNLTKETTIHKDGVVSGN